MKLLSAHIENFKGVKKADLVFERPEDTDPDLLHVILGDNGSGKTTILQAIALTLGLATRRISSIDRFAWHGFVPQRLATRGKTHVELNIKMDDDEVHLTQGLFQEWRKEYGRPNAQLVTPGNHSNLRLLFENGHVSCAEGLPGIAQFWGRFYVRQLAKARPELKEQFGNLGGVFWYDQYRNLGQSIAVRNGDEDEPPPESWVIGVDQLRDFLQNWWTYHLSGYKTGRDFIPELEKLFAMVFPGTRFRGPQPIDSSGAELTPSFYFLMERDERVFDISEMSSGEQAVFPLISDFVRMSIRKSLVLIDELELHLHPPEQQTLLASLQKFAPGCQFIITTHSPFVESVVPEHRKTRLTGGRPCL